MKYLVLLFVCILSVSLFAKKDCIKNSHPVTGLDACDCDKGYAMNPKGNVCCGPDAVWKDNKCVSCVKNSHPKIQKINDIDAAVSCDCNEGFVMNKAGNKCSAKK